MVNTMIIKKSKFRKALIENEFLINKQTEYTSIDELIDDAIDSCAHYLQVVPNSFSIRYANMDDSFIIDMDSLWFSINDLIVASGGCTNKDDQANITIQNFTSIDKKIFDNGNQFIIVKTIVENFYDRPIKLTGSSRTIVKDYYNHLPEIFKSNNPFENCNISMTVTTVNGYKVIISFNEDYTVILEPWDDGSVGKAFIYRSYGSINGSLMHSDKSHYEFPGYVVDLE